MRCPVTNSPRASADCRSDPIPTLALRPRDAAKALGIGERLLWSKTQSGEIPSVRIGRAVVYPIDQLREWLKQQVYEAAR